METIHISDNNIRISILLNDNKIFYIDHNDSNINISQYLSLLVMDNSIDFFNNNGQYALLYKRGKHETKTDNKIFRFKGVVVIASLSALILFNSYMTFKPEIVNARNISAYSSIEYDESLFRNKIFSSPNLTSQEKQYLYNEDFIEDILPFINSNNYLKYKFNKYLTDISIKPIGKGFERYDTSLGYYTPDTPNVLYIKDYDSINGDNEDTIAHEFVHLCQDTFGYNFIIEASAEIMSCEYYNNTKVNSYTSQVKLLKILMEIIGSEPIWHYSITGDFSLIEEKVKPYLTAEEYESFLSCMTFDYEDYATNEKKFNTLEKILSSLYSRIYEKDLEDNETIRQIRRNKTLVRNYFNKRLDESYYLDYTNAEYETISLDTAVKNKMVMIFSVKHTKTDFNTAMILLANSDYGVKREIDFSSAEISILRSKYAENKAYISAIIDGVRYDDVDVDDLVREGIIKADYYITDFKYLTADEYINHSYSEDAQISVSHNNDTIINEDYSVYGKVPKKVFIPTVFEKENSVQML